MNIFRRNKFSAIICKAFVALQIITLAACDSLIYDDLDPCDEGLRLRFVYDWNMEFANAFPSQVGCLTLLVYDKDGNYIETRTVTDESQLSDENWRMTLDLTPGDYKLLAYGGLACDDASFAFKAQPASTLPLESVEVELKPDQVGKNLHPLFYGYLAVTVPENSTDYTDATVKMMKDTNNVRIVLQNVNGKTVNNEDFNFLVTDDNTCLNWDNDIIPTASTNYTPWTLGQAVAGTDVVTGENVEVAYAEFSTSRFVTSSSARLEITRATDGQKVLSIPLVNYLLLLKSQQYDWMNAQEFLDRESRWNMIFFLDGNNYWINTQIEINGWVVRINDFDA